MRMGSKSNEINKMEAGIRVRKINITHSIQAAHKFDI